MSAAITNSLPAPAMPQFSVENVRNRRGREGIAYTATIRYNGKPFAELANDGAGGPTRYVMPGGGSIHTTKPIRDLLAWIRATQPAFMRYGSDDPIVLDEPWQRESAVELYFAWLVDRVEEDRVLRQICKTKVVFRVRGERQTDWQTMRADWKNDEAAVRERLRQIYGHHLLEIANERYT